MTKPASTIGHTAAKLLGIKLQGKEPIGDELTRGESIFSIQTSDTFIEEQPTSLEWILSQLPSRRDTTNYLLSLFPFLSWIGHYNVQWLIGDLVAGMYNWAT